MSKIVESSGDQYTDMGFRSPKHNCGVCGLPFYEDEMVRQRGEWVCEWCLDEKYGR